MTEVSVQEGSWVDSLSKRTLRYRLWRPRGAQRLLVILHGFGEHGGRYQAVAAWLAEQGLGVAVPDLSGHGRSSGQRGDLDIPRCVESLIRLTSTVFMPETGSREYALFGHSFGGLVAIHWALNGSPTPRRLVAQSPLLEVGFSIPGWKSLAARLLAGLWPTCSFSTGVDAAALSHDPAVVQAYQADPLVHHTMSARAYQSTVRTQDDAMARAGTLRVPVLLLGGSKDRIISLEAVRRWCDRVLCEKRQVMFNGCYHELHHEPVRDEVLRLIREWVGSDG